MVIFLKNKNITNILIDIKNPREEIFGPDIVAIMRMLQ